LASLVLLISNDDLVVSVCGSCALVDSGIDHSGGIDDDDVEGGDGVLRLVQGASFENYAVHQYNRTSCL
jgi:hypothetical protein